MGGGEGGREGGGLSSKALTTLIQNFFRLIALQILSYLAG